MLKTINIDKIVQSLYASIILNLIFLILKYDILVIINIIIFLTLLLIYLIFEKDYFIKLFIILLILISFGNITEAWDARSIWMLKAKIIFFENNVLNLKEYPLFSHPTYPTIAPAFAGSFAKLFGYWNEIFPRAGMTLLFIPPLIMLKKYFKGNYLYISYSFVIFIVGKQLFTGELDGLLSLYLFISLIIILNVIENKNINNFELITLFLNSVVLSLLKPEGTMLVFLMNLLVLTLIIKKKCNTNLLLIIFLSALPSLCWTFYSYNYLALYNINDTSYVFSSFHERYDDLENLITIFSYFITNNKFLLSLGLILITLLYKKNKEINLYLIFFSLVYLTILVVLYLSSIYELEWHLSSSFTRVIKPVTLSFCLFAVYSIKNQNG